MSIRVLIVDDHTLVRDGIRGLHIRTSRHPHHVITG